MGASAPRRPPYRGIVLGLLVLGAENGIPFLDTAQRYVLGYAVSNYMALALILLLALGVRPGKLTAGMGGLIAVVYLSVIWWVVTLWHSNGEPVAAAEAFGRNFLVFAVLAALFPLGLGGRQERREMLATFCVGAGLYSIGQIALTVSHRPIPWLVHPVVIRTSEVGLERVYAFMSDSAVLLSCLAIGAVLLAPTARLRRWGTLAALLSLAAVILQQTRAVYVSLPIAVIIVILWWVMAVPGARAALAGRTVAAVVAAASLVAALAVVAPSVLTTYAGKPLSRLSGAVVQISSGTGNLSYRFRVAHELLALLHGNPFKWAIGVGFLDPRYRYFPGLPLGSIRNPDLGLVDGIMLIGVVGVILTYLVVLIPLIRIGVEGRTRRLPQEDTWLLFGLMVWLTQVLIASYTLGTLFEQPGQVLVAMVAGVALRTLADRDAGRQAVTSPPTTGKLRHPSRGDHPGRPVTVRR